MIVSSWYGGKYRLNYLLFGIVCIIFFSNCGVKKHLSEGEHLVVSNDIIVDKDAKIENKSTLEYELSTLVKQKPNKKDFLFFRIALWAYYKTDEPQDTLNNGRAKFLQKRIAEKPSIYNEEVTKATTLAMRNYMNKKGYFNAEVVSEEELDTKRKTASVKYFVYPNKRYLIDSANYISEDSLLRPIIKDLERTSLFTKGEPVSAKLYNQEVNRIVDTLRNQGYAYFYPNYVQRLLADSTDNKYNLDLDLTIIKPIDDDQHRVYRIGKVTIYPRFQPTQPFVNIQESQMGAYQVMTQDGNVGVKEQVLLDHIHLHPGALYRQRDYDLTTNQLGDLGMYKFINIRPVKNEEEEGIIDFEISLTPSKRQSFGTDLEVNNSNRTLSSLRSSFLGFGVGLNYRNRNALNGGELLVSSLQMSTEFNRRVRFQSFDFLVRSDLYFPKFLDYVDIYKILNKFKLGKKIKFVTDGLYKDLKEKGRSRISVGYNYQQYRNFYRFHSGNISFGYDLQRNQNSRYIVNHAGIDFLSPTIESEFQPVFDSNPFLANSFTKQFFTGIIVRNISYFYNSNPNLKGVSWSFRVNAEQSGAEVLLINWMANNNSKPFEFNSASGEKITFSHHAKFDIDTRLYKIFNDDNSLAFRLSAGVATPFGKLSTEVPFVKQFFLGGPTSLRAWRIRELGPGTYNGFSIPLLPPEPPYYQTGDVKLEFNAEYRFDLISYLLLKGAVFIDGGNIWTLKLDPDRPGSQLSTNFLNELALGGGFGFRFDVSYFIFRLDLGYKLLQPYKDENGNRWQFYRWKDWGVADYFRGRNVNYNIALGFPF